MENQDKKTSNFIRDIIIEDIKTEKHNNIVTRFPPEPNGYLHIGHAKSICINFGMAKEFGGECYLRFDDTNPSKEEDEYIHAIKKDVAWLGFDLGEHLYFASDYFAQMYKFATTLIKNGKAYVEDLNAEQIREYRGTLTKSGKESPCRNRSIDENLTLFEKMRNGDFLDGSKVLRAKIDMASPNINLRDPIMYRILKVSHHRTKDYWCIYPLYDWAHGLEDSIEKITHSLCTLEFEDHRPLYDWFLNELDIYHPRQIEFARLNITYTIMSKRKLLILVQQNKLNGWDDPRILTISGMRRRGYTSLAIRNFCEHVGVAKRASTVDMALLEYYVRDDLNKLALRVMGVFNPLKIVITNYPDGEEELLDAINNPNDETAGTRKVPFSKELYIERDDFMEDAPKKFFRLTVGREVRLRYAFFIKCNEVIKDNDGKIIELHCTYDSNTRGGNALDGRKVKATIHWISIKHAIDVDVRLYESLFTKENPDDIEDGGSFIDNINPDSLKVLSGCKVEPSLANAKVGAHYQFERIGYFCVDEDSNETKRIFNRTITLRDSWAKIQKMKGK